MKSLQKLTQALGYEFKDQTLLAAALSHRSARAINNERLEFLGDSLLNCIIASELYVRYPHAPEGRLSRLRSLLVREETLAELAKSFKLGEFLALGPGELKSGGSRRSSILADAMEAVIAAIYLDADFNTCQRLVLEWFVTRFDDAAIESEEKDSKTELQEYLQAKRIPLPQYEIITVGGEVHAQIFQVVCEIPKLRLKATGEGTSRRKAEQEAAKLILQQIKQR